MSVFSFDSPGDGGGDDFFSKLSVAPPAPPAPPPAPQPAEEQKPEEPKQPEAIHPPSPPPPPAPPAEENPDVPAPTSSTPFSDTFGPGKDDTFDFAPAPAAAPVLAPAPVPVPAQVPAIPAPIIAPVVAAPVPGAAPATPTAVSQASATPKKPAITIPPPPPSILPIPVIPTAPKILLPVPPPAKPAPAPAFAVPSPEPPPIPFSVPTISPLSPARLPIPTAPKMFVPTLPIPEPVAKPAAPAAQKMFVPAPVIPQPFTIPLPEPAAPKVLPIPAPVATLPDTQAQRPPIGLPLPKPVAVPSPTMFVPGGSRPLSSSATTVVAPVPIPLQPVPRAGGVSPSLYSSGALTMAEQGGGRPPHAVCCFGFGGRMLTIYPPKAFSRSCVMYLRGSAGLLKGDPAHDRLAAFPGPLVRGSTSQDAVTEFASRQAADSAGAETEGAEGDDGRRLMWDLLALLCANYGSLSTSTDGTGDHTKLLALFEKHRPHVQQQQQPPQPQQAPSEEAVQRLLVSGKKQEALKAAIAGRLWAHALILSQQISQRAFQESAAAFAQGALAEGDPTRTLFMLFAQQPQELFRGMARGGRVPLLERWVENLSAIIANRGVADRAVIGELGDRLWSVKGAVPAAHACYLVAEHGFGFVDNPNARLVLLGADHKRRYASFVTPEAIQATEVYEFAKTSGNPQFTLAPFQVYKLIYAQLLADAGLVSAAQKYVAAITAAVKSHQRDAFGAVFLRQLAAFEERLKKHGHHARAASSGGGWSSLGSWLPSKMRLFSDRSVTPPARSTTPPTMHATSLSVPPQSPQPPLPPAASTAAPTESSSSPHKTSGSSGGGGWFGKILGRKQMVLPEGNDEIKWDDATKTWRSAKEVGTPLPPPAATAAHVPAASPAVAPATTQPVSTPSSFMAMAMAMAPTASAVPAEVPARKRNPRYIDPMTQQIRTAAAAASPTAPALAPVATSLAPGAAAPKFFVPAALSPNSAAAAGVEGFVPFVPAGPLHNMPSPAPETPSQTPPPGLPEDSAPKPQPSPKPDLA